jgi:hypothetical protein
VQPFAPFRDSMSGKTPTDILEAMELEKARHLEKAAALDRKMAELAQLAQQAAKYNLVLAAPDEVADSADRTDAPAPKSFSDLIAVYKSAANSPYKKLTHASRRHYDTLLGLVQGDHGAQLISDLAAEDLEEWHRRWSEGGKISTAHAKIGMVRGLCGFGTEVLRDRECERLFGILAKLKFKAPKARTERLTASQANEIRAMARNLKRPSIALAQAFQYGLGMLQKDVIGEWVPVAENGVSDVTHGTTKWIRGLRWNEIDSNFVLRHSSDSWRGDVEFDLRKAPIVLDELRIQFGFSIDKSSRSQLPLSGPVIVSERDKLPWDAVEFRRWWRKAADACGIPKTVRNSDSRSRANNGAQEETNEMEERVAK